MTLEFMTEMKLFGCTLYLQLSRKDIGHRKIFRILNPVLIF